MDTDSSSTAITAAPAGMSLSSWSDSRRVSKTSTFRLLKLAGLELGKVRLPGINKPVSWLEQHQVDVLDQLAQQLAAGVSLAKLEAAGGLTRTVPAPSKPTPSAEALLARLQALESAIRSGAKLSTAEATLLLGTTPGGSTTQCGRVIARRVPKTDGSGTIQNAWTLEAGG